MKSYYAIETPLRYYGFAPEVTEVGEKEGDLSIDGRLESEIDISRWKEMPHECLANLPLSFNLSRSTSELGLSSLERSELSRSRVEANRPSLEAMDMFIKRYGLLAAETSSDEDGNVYFRESAFGFVVCQNTLQEAWKGNARELRNMRKQVQRKLRVGPTVEAGRIGFVTEQLWPFVCMLFFRDYAAGKTKVCANPDCPHPYFLKERKGQMYCSHPCAVLINVRRFRGREREADRKRGKIHRKRKEKQ